ncbi:unnamed protein product [Closterium sp. Yama58-4]|nr:unnamed protein product [Closterium sp. Yama58-4]
MMGTSSHPAHVAYLKVCYDCGHVLGARNFVTMSRQLSARWPLPRWQPLLMSRAVLPALQGTAHVAPCDWASCWRRASSAMNGEVRAEGGVGNARTRGRVDEEEGRGKRQDLPQGRGVVASGGGAAVDAGRGQGGCEERSSMGHGQQHFPPCSSAHGVQPCALRSPRYTRVAVPHVLREGGLQHVLQRVGLWPAPPPHHRLPPGFPPRERGDARMYPGVGVAVSGGVDSMALALTAARMQRAQQGEGEDGGGGGVRMVAMVVDHALRPGSAREATRTLACLHHLGLQAVLLTCRWPHGPPPPSRLQQDARAQRYALLHGECVKRHLPVLMTAHHANDQAELLLLRLARCSGVDGLACMPLLSPLPPSPPPLLPCFAPLHAHGNGSIRPGTSGSSRSNGRSTDSHFECVHGSSSGGSGQGGSEAVVVVRPLLGVGKEHLVQLCESLAHPWIDDPSNASSLFLRNRIRHALAALPPHHATAVHLAAQSTSAVAAALRSHRLTAARRLAAQALLPTSGGAVHISVVELLAPHWSHDTRMHVLSLLLQHVGQRAYPPRTRGVRALLDRMRLYLSAASWGAYSMAGCTLTALPGSRGTVACIAAHAPTPAT